MSVRRHFLLSSFFFFNDTATTEIYTLSLHDALPISRAPLVVLPGHGAGRGDPHQALRLRSREGDRKSTRLNSSHGYISYAVFCLKKKKKKTREMEIVRKTKRHIIALETENGSLQHKA